MTSLKRTPQYRIRSLRRNHVAGQLMVTSLVAAFSLLDLSQWEASVALIAVAAAPVLCTVVALRRVPIWDPLLFLGAIYVVGGALPALFPGSYQDPFWAQLSPGYLEAGTLWTCRAYACFVLGYLIVTFSLGNKGSESASDPLGFDSRALFLCQCIGWIGLGGAIAWFVVNQGVIYAFVPTAVPTDFPSYKQTLYNFKQLGYIYVFLYVLLRYTGQNGGIYRWLLYGVLLIQVLVFVGSGSKGVLFSIILSGLLALAFSEEKPLGARTMGFGLVSIVALFLTFSIVNEYREIVRVTQIPQRSLGAQVSFQMGAFGNAINKVITGEQSAQAADASSDSTSDEILNRFSIVSSVGFIMQLTNGRPPYENAWHSLMTPVYAVAPRDFFPEKPEFFNSADFAQRLGWEFGGFSVGLIGSFYWAWGYVIGICIGMAAVGGLLAWINMAAQRTRDIIFKVLLISFILALSDTGIGFQDHIVQLTRIAVLLVFLDVAYRLFGAPLRYGLASR